MVESDRVLVESGRLQTEARVQPRRGMGWGEWENSDALLSVYRLVPDRVEMGVSVSVGQITCRLTPEEAAWLGRELLALSGGDRDPARPKRRSRWEWQWEIFGSHLGESIDALVERAGAAGWEVVSELGDDPGRGIIVRRPRLVR